MAVFAGGVLASRAAQEPEVQVSFALLARAPFGGRLMIEIRNTGTVSLDSVFVNGTIPEGLIMAGAEAVPTGNLCANGLSATDTTCQVAREHPVVLPPGAQPVEDTVGQTIRLDGEHILVTGRTAPAGSTLVLARGVNGTAPAAHAAGTRIHFMRPAATASGSGDTPYCVVGLARQIGCTLHGLSPGGRLVVDVYLGVRPGTSNLSGQGFDLTVASGQTPPQTLHVRSHAIGELLAASAGPFNVGVPLLARDSDPGQGGERLRVPYAASFPANCEVASGTSLTWVTAGWVAASEELVDEFEERTPIYAILDEEPVPLSSYTVEMTVENASGVMVPGVARFWEYAGPALPAGSHTFSFKMGPSNADISDGLEPAPIPAGTVIYDQLSRTVVVTPAASYPATSLPLCSMMAR